MKLLLIVIYLSLFSNLCISQEVKAFVNDTVIKTYKSLKEFKKNSILQLTDTSLKIKSYVAYFGCNYNFHKVEEELCNISVTTVLGNTLQDKSFVELLNKYQNHFYVVFDNILYIDKAGLTKVALSLGRVDIN